MGNPIQAFYEQTGATYDRFYSTTEYPGLANVLRLRIVLRRLAELGAKSVFDAGVGSGRVLEQAVQMGLRIGGCDFAPAMVQAARARLGEKALLSVADMEDALTLGAAFAAGPWDALTAFGPVNQARGAPQTVLANLRGLLRLGGRAFIEFNNSLFALFTLNRVSKDWILGDLLAGVTGPIRLAVEQEIDKRFNLDWPPRDSRRAHDNPAYPRRFYNPFTLPEMLRLAGFGSPRFYWYHYHAGFPWLHRADDEAEWAKQCLALENPDDWRGYFLCSVVLVETEAI